VVALSAYLVNRYLARARLMPKAPLIVTDPLLNFSLRVIIALGALFLVLFPYPGIPRLIAIGILLIALLGALLAMRPLIEEVASGIYLTGTCGLRKGDQLMVDRTPYLIEKPGLIHIHLRRDGESCWLPYSRLLKAELRIQRGPQS
jgi:hypothetical protein